MARLLLSVALCYSCHSVELLECFGQCKLHFKLNFRQLEIISGLEEQLKSAKQLQTK